MKCYICDLSTSSNCDKCKKETCDIHLLDIKKTFFFKKKYCQHCFYANVKKSVF